MPKKIVFIAMGFLGALVVWQCIVGQPNFGGVAACEKATGIDGLSELGISTDWPGLDWSVAQRFRFKITESSIEELEALLLENGFPPFKKGGLTFADYSSSVVGRMPLLASRKSRTHFILAEEEGILEVIILPR